MLRLNVNEQKQLTFEIQIGGVQYDKVNSLFKLVLGEIEYGFPAKVGRDQITVDLPPLKNVIGAKMIEGDQVDIKLEIIADGHFLTPWQDRAILSNPLVVEATIKDTAFIGKPALQTKLVVEEDGAKQTTIIEEKREEDNDDNDDELSETLVNRLIEKLGKMINNTEQSDLPPSPEKEEEEEKGEVTKEEISPKQREALKKGRNSEKAKAFKKKLMNKKKTDVDPKLENLLNKTIDALKLNESKPSKKKMTLEEFKHNLSKDDVLKYMEKKGTKNKQIQDIIYEQAKEVATKDEPAYILKEIVKIMKK